MESYDRETKPLHTTTRNWGVTSVSEPMSCREILYVSNGNVVGNRVDPNPFQFRKYVYTYEIGGTYTEAVGHDYRVRSDSTNGVLSSPLISHLRNDFEFWDLLVDKAMSKVYDSIRGDSNFAVDLAESASTLKMLRSTLSFRKLLAGFLKEAVRGRGYKKSRGQARLDYLTSKWLEYRYGWMPLVSSCYDAAESLRGEYLVNRGVPVKARATQTDTVRSVTGLGTFESPKVTTETAITARVLTCVRFKPDLPAVADFTSLNPAAIAWELLPLSFVADWFVNVSQQLELWENYMLWSSRFQSGYQTQSSLTSTTRKTFGYTDRSLQYYSDGTPVPYQTGSQYVDKTATLRETSLNRTVLVSLPRPQEGFKIRVNFGSKRQLDAAALIHQLVAKRFR